MCACRPEEGTRSPYRWLWVTMWLLGLEHRISRRAASSEPSLQPWSGLLKQVSFLKWVKSKLHIWSF
jgi:MYXO-CTERM domain-containing protein